MRNILFGLAVSAAAVTGPVAAQGPVGGYQNRGVTYRDGDEGRRSMSARIEQLRDRIETGVQSGAINRQEAMPLRSGLRSLTQLERRYSRNGLNDQETRDLQMRLRTLSQDVRRADEGGSGRYDEWDRRYGQDDDRYGDRDDRDYGAMIAAMTASGIGNLSSAAASAVSSTMSSAATPQHWKSGSARLRAYMVSRTTCASDIAIPIASTIARTVVKSIRLTRVLRRSSVFI